MHLDDLFTAAVRGADPWATLAEEPKMDVIEELIAGPIRGDDDLATAIALANLVHSELEEFGTAAQSQRLDGDQIAIAQRALRATLARHGINLNLPWRDFNGFRSYWITRGASGPGGWQARRDILNRFFGPAFAELDRLEDLAFASALAESVSPASGTGWPAVDTALADVRTRFRSAVTSADYQDVGRRCVAVMEALSGTVYDPTRHLRDGETEPPVSKTHMRIIRYVDDALAGAGNVEVRTLVRKAAELAEAVKHRPGGTRRDAGIAADSVILLANILRRIATE